MLIHSQLHALNIALNFQDSSLIRFEEEIGCFEQREGLCHSW